jgi:hypothetical protein
MGGFWGEWSRWKNKEMSHIYLESTFVWQMKYFFYSVSRLRID